MVAETRVVTKFLRDHPEDSWTIEAALANGTYATLDSLFDKAPEDIVKQVADSGLRGRGGAGFGTGQKWSFLPKDVFPRYLAVNGDDLDRVVTQYGDRIAHVQIADAPGRHEPGTGDLDLTRLVEDIHTRGYKGWTALEYKPSTTTADSFGWIAQAAATRA